MPLMVSARFASFSPASHSPSTPKHSPFADQHVFAWGYAHVGSHTNELPAKSLEFAVQSVSGSKTPSKEVKGSPPEFYDAALRRCLLCELPITNTYQTHLGRHEHQARLGVIERALALIHASQSERKNAASRESGRLKAKRPLPPSLGGKELMAFRTLRSPSNMLVPEGGSNVPDSVFGSKETEKKSIVDEVAQHWWNRLDAACDLNEVIGVSEKKNFNRISELSSAYSMERRWRLRFLLEFLKFHGVLQASLSIANATISPEAFARSRRFEMLETVGDCVVKVEMPDRLIRVFPHGVCNKLALVQRFIDSNSGLLEIYDYLMLNTIIGAQLANSKAKADVVECIFGELQCFLWATEVQSDSINTYNAHPSAPFHYLRAIVQHTMHELMHTILMWRLEATLKTASKFIQSQVGGVKMRLQGGQPNNRKRLEEKDFDRGRYSVLPLIADSARPHPLTLGSPGDLWYHTTHVYHSAPDCDTVALLGPSPIPKPVVFQDRMEDVQAMWARGMIRPTVEDIEGYTPSKTGFMYPQWGMEEQRSYQFCRAYDKATHLRWSNAVIGEQLRSQLARLSKQDVDESTERSSASISSVDWGSKPRPSDHPSVPIHSLAAAQTFYAAVLKEM